MPKPTAMTLAKVLALSALTTLIGSVQSASATQSCTKDFEPFMGAMLTELPAYINRVYVRANTPQNSVLLATNTDFQPLPLPTGSDRQSLPQGESQTRQVFFSTLLRQRSSDRIVYQQEHHWLFMAPSDRGWEFVQLYSTLSPYPKASIQSAPRNSSEGSVATAIKNWLKNCHYQQKRSLP